MDETHDASLDSVAASSLDITNDDYGKEMPQTSSTQSIISAESVSQDTDENGKQLLPHQIVPPIKSTEIVKTDIVNTEIDTTLQPKADLLSDTKIENTNGTAFSFSDTIDRDDGTTANDTDIEKTSTVICTAQHKQSDSNATNGVLSDKIVKEKLPKISVSLDSAEGHVEVTDVMGNIPLNDKPVNMDDLNNDIVAALQENLQNQMSAKAEAEDKVRKLELNVRILEDQIQKQADEMLKLDTIEENLQLQMNAKAEAEHKARSAYDRVQQLEAENKNHKEDVQQAQQQLSESLEVIADKDRELDKVRHERDEYERKVTALTTRLNAAKKLEAVKVNHVDEIEDDLKVTSEELRQVKLELEQSLSAKRHLEQQLQCIEIVSKEQIELLEKSLTEEKRLNEERKMKMKEYVEKKTEELRQTKEENDSLQMELTQTNRSLVELNTRWKQIHTQWVQAQTRNRELQRDLQRTKKDSEHLHKQGDTLEMKLSRSANETEEHKNKRLAAKQELMSVLRALEMERDVTTKLRDQMKFTFVPKMLHQQQTLNEIIQEFTTALEKLSIRLGKPLLPLPEESEHEEASNVTMTNGSHNDSALSQSDINPLVEKLDYESQKVSSAITTVLQNIERLRALVQASGDRTCFTVLSELVHTGGMESSPAVQADRARNQLQAAIGRSHRYGQVPGTSD